jgi:hypothetical protein
LRPSATPAANRQLALPTHSSGCAGFRPPACAGCPTFRLDRGPTPPSRIGVLPRGSTGGKHSARTACPALPTDRWLTFQLALASLLRLGLRPLPTHIVRCFFSSARVRLPALAGCRCNLQLALSAAATSACTVAARLPPRRRTSDSHRLFLHRLHRFRLARLAPCASTSGWASDAPLASTEPCIAG